MVRSPEPEAAKGRKEEEAAKEWDLTQILTTKAPVKSLVFYQDSDEEEDAAREEEGLEKEKEAEVLPLTETGEGSHEAPKDKAAMPN